MSVKALILNVTPPFLMPYWDRIEASPIGYRLAKGAFWSLAGAVISRALGLLASILVARMLGKVGFGELGIIQSTIGMFGVFAGFGLGVTATKYVAEFRAKDPHKAGRIIALSGMVAIITGGVMALALFIFAPWLAEHTLAAPQLAGLIRIGSLFLFLSALNGNQTGALAGFEAFKTIAHVNLVAGLAAFPLMVGAVWLWGTEGAVWALVVSMAINWALNHLALRKKMRRHKVPFTFRDCDRELSVLWKFSLPAVLGGAVVVPIMWAGNAILVNQPDGYSEMGVYNAILRVKQVPEMVLIMLITPLLPMLSESFGMGDTKSYNKLLSYAFALSLCIVVPVSLIQAAMPTLTLLPYGQEYQGNTSVVQWAMLHAVIIGLFQPFGSILSSMNRMWFGFTYNLSWGATFMPLAYLFVPRYGAAGLAAACALTYLVTSLVCVAYIHHYEKAFIVDTPLIYCTVSSLLLFSICIVANRCVSPLIAGGIGCAMAFALVVTLLRFIRVRRALPRSAATAETAQGE